MAHVQGVGGGRSGRHSTSAIPFSPGSLVSNQPPQSHTGQHSGCGNHCDCRLLPWYVQNSILKNNSCTRTVI